MTSLLEQNRWLRDPKMRTKLLRVSAASSSAVEGIRKPYEEPRKPVKSGAPAKKRKRA